MARPGAALRGARDRGRPTMVSEPGIGRYTPGLADATRRV